MKLSEYKSVYIKQSTAASDQSRKLAFAGIAIVWIYKTGSTEGFTLDSALHAPVILFALGLVLDLFHYLVSAIIWRLFFRRNEKRLLSEAKDENEKSKVLDSDVLAHPALPMIPWVIWGGKIACVIAGHVCLIIFLANKLL